MWCHVMLWGSDDKAETPIVPFIKKIKGKGKEKGKKDKQFGKGRGQNDKVPA